MQAGAEERCRCRRFKCRRGAGAGRGDAGASVQVRKCGISGWSDGDLHDPDPVRLALLLRRLHEAPQEHHLPGQVRTGQVLGLASESREHANLVRRKLACSQEDFD